MLPNEYTNKSEVLLAILQLLPCIFALFDFLLEIGITSIGYELKMQNRNLNFQLLSLFYSDNTVTSTQVHGGGLLGSKVTKSLVVLDSSLFWIREEANGRETGFSPGGSNSDSVLCLLN